MPRVAISSHQLITATHRTSSLHFTLATTLHQLTPLPLGRAPGCPTLTLLLTDHIRLRNTRSALGRSLRLAGLLRRLLLLLVLLALLDGRSARRLSCLGALRSLFLDHVQRGANDAALGFDGAAGALFGYFLLVVGGVISLCCGVVGTSWWWRR